MLKALRTFRETLQILSYIIPGAIGILLLWLAIWFLRDPFGTVSNLTGWAFAFLGTVLNAGDGKRPRRGSGFTSPSGPDPSGPDSDATSPATPDKPRRRRR